MLLKDEEIAKLKIKSSYDEGIDDWIIPPFILKGKEVTLPSLKKNGYDVMEQEKENRDLAIENDESDENENANAAAGRRTGGFNGARHRS